MANKLKYYLFLVPLALTLMLKAQVNIVPNGDFEEYEVCPVAIQNVLENTLGHNWFSSLPSPDYFNICATASQLQIPQNMIGYQTAYSGNGYIGFGIARPYGFISPSYYYNQSREIVGVKLKYKLSKDSTYTIGFYVSLADTVSYTMKDWGCMFSKDSLYITSWGNPSAVALEVTEKYITSNNVKANLFPDSLLKNTTDWIKVESTFIAQGGEQYMYLGSFMQWNEIIWGNGQNIDTTCDYCRGTYYYIDDVYLYGDTNYKAVGIKENIFEQIKVYPNPANDIVTVNTCYLKNIQIELFDISGRKLFQQNVNSSQGIIDVSSLANGVYICTITSNNQVVKRERVIISR